MAAVDAVTSTAVARREVRNSMERLQYHLGRGAKGRRGVEREVRFLDALHRRSVAQAGAAVGANFSGRPLQSFGAKAAQALSTGRASDIGRMKSSLLADFAVDSLTPARDWTRAGGPWLWTANASACPTCLDRHGRAYEGTFTPSHPSCLCIPQPVGTPGLRPLSDEEMVDMQSQYGDARYRSQMEGLSNGTLSRAEVAGAEAVNSTASGLRAVAEHAAKGEVRQTGLTAGVAPDTAEAILAATDARAAMDSSVLYNQRVAELVGRTPLDPDDVALLDETMAKVDALLRQNGQEFYDKARLLLENASVNLNITTEGAITEGGRWAKVGNLNRLDLELNRAGLKPSELVAKMSAEGASTDEILAALQNASNYARASADELAEVIVHELGHGLDFKAGEALARALSRDGIYDAIGEAYASNEAFWYAASSPKEAVAELLRMYSSGTGIMGKARAGAVDMTAAEWRAAYPQLSEWVVKNVL